MSATIRLLLPALVAAGLMTGCNGGQQTHLSYELDIKPVIENHCADCHADNGKGVRASGFSVDTYASLMQGTKYGPVVVAGNPRSSKLYHMVAGQIPASRQKPHDRERLSAGEIEKVARWIEQGAIEI